MNQLLFRAIILVSIIEMSCPKTDCPKKYVLLFIVVLFCDEYKATIISTTGKLKFALVLLLKSFYRTTVIFYVNLFSIINHKGLKNKYSTDNAIPMFFITL